MYVFSCQGTLEWKGLGGWLVFLLVAVSAISSAELRGQETGAGVLVRFDEAKRPVISRLDPGEKSVRLAPDELGVVIWTEEAGDRYRIFRGAWERPSRQPPQVWEPGTVRAAATGGAPSAASVCQMTTQLDPLFLPGVVKSLEGLRGGPLLTPPDGGVLLGNRPTFRRRPGSDERLEDARYLLSNGTQTARIRFEEGADEVRFAAFEQVPPTWKPGLPSGKYRVTREGSAETITTFEVEERAVAGAFLASLREWEQLLGSTSDPLYVLVAVESLIAAQPRPYLADALDRIDDVPGAERTDYLEWRRASIIAALERKPEPLPPELAGDATGIAAVDKARVGLARGRWKDAMASLDRVGDTAERRERGLADLYRGVLHAEWGPGQEQAADFYFRKALAGLEGAAAPDRYRALNNYANFLLDRTQDRILDHAFQLASGVRGLFVTAVDSWDASREFYRAAAEVAVKLGAEQQAAVALNQARLEAILADLLATLDSPDDDAKQLGELVEAALGRSAEHAQRALALSPDESDPLRSAAAGLRGQLAARSGHVAEARHLAEEARRLYLRSGSLTGIEWTERLLGFVTLRAEEPPSSAVRQAARRHFQIAQMLAELLRRRLPPEQIGRTSAGFFARRTYVNEQLVELLVADGQFREALRYVELAKARALQDLLAWHGPLSELSVESGLDEVLESWPAGVVALEYYLTREHAWVFQVGLSGQVRAVALRDPAGQPISSRQLIAHIQSVLRAEFNQYGAVLRGRMLDGRGFDHAWQDRLHMLYQVLVPEPLRAELSEAEQLLIVPHHILHYFPFAALVCQPDRQPRGPLEMVQPRFLLDEPYPLCYAPSLATWQLLRGRDQRPLRSVAAAAVPQLPGAVPLPGVRQELNYLADAFPRRLSQVVTGEQATRERTLKLLQEPGMLLIGSHGQNYPDQPLASEVLMYPSGTDSGRLTAAALYTSRVKSDLVVLSACYTALADRSPLPGDDLFGLSRALLQSGARTVVTGYWDVFEGTGPEIMRGFFDRLSRGESVPAALAEAQRGFLAPLRASREPEPYLHPYFWAVFGAQGDDRTQFEKPRA